MRDAVRVALLARPGAGSDRLREALRAAGADLVLDADPTTLEPDTLAAAGAESVVVLLDSAVEDALERLDPVLHDPAVDVLYEESEVAAAREGWDVARWTRHLSAKLLRHGDVLPPGREADVDPAVRGASAEPTTLPAPADAAPAATPASMFDPVSAEYDATEPVVVEPIQPEPVASERLELDLHEFDVAERAPDDADATTDAASGPQAETLPGSPAESPSAPEPPAAYDGGLTLSLEGDDDAPADVAPPHPAPVAPAAPAVPGSMPAPRSDALRDFRRDLASIEQRIASMGLVDPEPSADEATGESGPAAPSALHDATVPDATAVQDEAAVASAADGAVLVFAGIGGPDAVRQFLGALPAGFPRPVLIHQRLDGGRHDRLVQQMARATSLPVQLAADGEPLVAGHVYVLPPGLGLGDGATGLRFVAGGDPIATLPPGGSAVLMFSGSDIALVDAAMGHAQAGALVAGQSPEDCYDAAAADALVARGAESGQPADLARRLAERWAA